MKTRTNQLILVVDYSDSLYTGIEFIKRFGIKQFIKLLFKMQTNIKGGRYFCGDEETTNCLICTRNIILF